MTKIREYKLLKNGAKIIAPITKILSVQEKDGGISVWAETNKLNGNNLFVFVVVPNGWDIEQLPHYKKAKYLNTVLLDNEAFHVYFYHAPGKKFLQRELEEESVVFFDSVFGDGIKEEII